MSVVCAAANTYGYRGAREEGTVTSIWAGRFFKEGFTKRCPSWVLKGSKSLLIGQASKGAPGRKHRE